MLLLRGVKSGSHHSQQTGETSSTGQRQNFSHMDKLD